MIRSKHPLSMSDVDSTRSATNILIYDQKLIVDTLQNIVLSGGSTMFKDFGRRLQQDLKLLVDRRIQTSETASGAHIKVSNISFVL